MEAKEVGAVLGMCVWDVTKIEKEKVVGQGADWQEMSQSHFV